MCTAANEKVTITEIPNEKDYPVEFFLTNTIKSDNEIIPDLLKIVISRCNANHHPKVN